MRWWKCNGLVPGQTVNAHIEEAAHCQTQNGEDDYQDYFHGCLLWTHHRPEVNTWRALPLDVASSVIVAHFSLVIARAKAPRQSYSCGWTLDWDGNMVICLLKIGVRQHVNKVLCWLQWLAL
jgi:hypothetical protein